MVYVLLCVMCEYVMLSEYVFPVAIYMLSMLL